MCFSVGKCARAPARRPTPTPRLFFSGKRGDSQDASFGRKLSIKASHRRVDHDRIRCFGAARCNFAKRRAPSSRSSREAGGGDPGWSGEGRGKVKGPSLREGAEVCRGDRVSAEICVRSAPPACFQVELVRGHPAHGRRNLPFPRAPSEAGARLAGTARPGPPPGLRRPRPVTCGESAPAPGLAALHADRPPPAPPARTERGARFPPRPRGPSPLNWLQPAAAGSQAGRGRAGRPGGAGAGVARSYLAASVSSVSATAAAPAVAAAATFLGSAPPPPPPPPPLSARLSSPARSPSAASLRPPPRRSPNTHAPKPGALRLPRPGRPPSLPPRHRRQPRPSPLPRRRPPRGAQ